MAAIPCGIFLDGITIISLSSVRKAGEKPAAPHKEVGFIAVSSGEGLSEVFKDLGADYIIEGGQTMNPSTEDMLDAIATMKFPCLISFPSILVSRTAYVTWPDFTACISLSIILADLILQEHEEMDIEVQYGGQPIYSYFVSVE